MFLMSFVKFMIVFYKRFVVFNLLFRRIYKRNNHSFCEKTVDFFALKFDAVAQ